MKFSALSYSLVLVFAEKSWIFCCLSRLFAPLLKSELLHLDNLRKFLVLLLERLFLKSVPNLVFIDIEYLLLL